MIFFKLFLLSGLIAHKALWMMMKRGSPAHRAEPRRASPRLLAVKAVKVAILLGVAAQIFAGDILPIMPGDAASLRIVGGVVYAAGLCIAMLGRLQLGNNWTDIEVGKVLQKHRVVSRGVYRFIRHPIYVGDLLLLLGLELALNSSLVVMVVILAGPVLAKAVQEERLLEQSLAGYAEYAKNTKRFIPFVV